MSFRYRCQHTLEDGERCWEPPLGSTDYCRWHASLRLFLRSFERRAASQRVLGYACVVAGTLYGFGACSHLLGALVTIDLIGFSRALLSVVLSATCLGLGAVLLGRQHARWVKLWVCSYLALGVVLVCYGVTGLIRPDFVAAALNLLDIPRRLLGPTTLVFGVTLLIEALWLYRAASPRRRVRYAQLGGMVAALLAAYFFQFSPLWWFVTGGVLAGYVLNEEFGWVRRMRRW